MCIRDRERIGAHRLAHQRGQPLRALAEVDRLRRDHDADRAGRADHDPAFNAPSTAAIVAGEAPFSIVTLMPATSISMAAACAAPSVTSAPTASVRREFPA